MVRFLFALLTLAAASPALAGEKQYTVTDFDKVEVNGPYEVTLSTGRSSSARANGSPDALDRVVIEVQGSTLRVHANPSSWGGYPGASVPAPTAIVLTTRDLRAARINGSGTLTVGTVSAMRLDVSVAGSGALIAPDLHADILSAVLVGSGRLQLGGKAKSFRAEIHGSGDLQADSLTADDAVIAADTAGTVRLAATRSANVTSTATGDVAITGSPACTVKLIGTGNVRCGRN